MDGAVPSPDELTTIRGSFRAPRADGPALGETSGELSSEGLVEFGRYVLLGKLGEGGMSIVYAAYDRQLDRKVAIKVLRDRDGDAWSGGHHRLRREAQAMAMLSHPNVAHVYDVGEHGGQIFLAMEFIEGVSLREWVGRGAKGWREVAAMLRQVAAGLAAAHRSGILHRDLKPENVIVDGDGRARVLDFGLARAEDSVSGDPTSESAPKGFAGGSWAAGALADLLTAKDELIGTPAYMAPEQFRSEPATFKSDQFSFCVMAFELLYGKRPFGGRDFVELSRAICNKRLASIPPGHHVPGWLHALVLKGLEPRPDQRWPSIEAIMARLDRGMSARLRWRVGAVFVGAALATGGATASRALDDRCAEGSTAFDAVWNDASRSSIERAFAATELAYAPEATDSTLRAIDEYGGAWVDAYREVCRGRERDEVSDELFDRQMGCLRERLDGVSALLDVLGRADRTAVQHAAQASVRLPELGGCIDTEQLLDHRFVPTDEIAALQAEVLRQRLQSVRAQTWLGHFPSAAEEAKRIVDDARQLGYPPVLAEALYELAKALDREGRYEQAALRAEEALWQALSVGYTELEASAAIELVMIRGDRLAKFDAAEIWVAHARAAVQHLDGGPLWEARLEHSLGSMRYTQGDLEAAADHYRHVLELRQAALGPEHPDVAAVMVNLGSVLKDQGDYAGSLALQRRALELRERTLGREHPEVGLSHHSVAITLENQGHYDAAIQSYERAAEILEHALGPDHLRVAYPRFGLATVYMYTGRHEAAHAEFSRVLPVLEKHLGPKHPHIETTHNNIGLVLYGQGKLEQASAAFERSRAIAVEVLGPDHGDVARALGNLGMARFDLGDLPGAKRAYEESLAIYEKVLGPDHPDLGYPLTGIGKVAYAMKRYDDAIAALRRAVAVRRDVPAAERAECRFWLARSLWEQGDRRREAIAVADEASTLYEQAEGKDEAAREVQRWLAERR